MSTSNIVPYYSSSPPPLDEDDAAHSLDDDEDEFGDFSSAPRANTAVDVLTLKTSANESVCFRPISDKLQPDPLNDDRFEGDHEGDEPPKVFGVESEPVNYFSPAFTSDQFLSGNRKDSPVLGEDAGLHSISTGKEQGVINDSADNGSKISSESNCQRETNNKDERQFEKSSDLSDSTNFASIDSLSHHEDHIKNEEEEERIVHDILTDQCSFTDLASVNTQDTMVPEALKDRVPESLGLDSVRDANKDVVTSAVENVAEDEFDDFESFECESSFSDNQLKLVVSETTSDGADISLKEAEENVAPGVTDEEGNVKTVNDFKGSQAAGEFDDFESFQDEIPVKPDSSVTEATSGDAEISVKKVQDDVIADVPNSKSKLNATNDFKEFESAQEFDDFESFQDEIPVNHDSSVIKATSGDAEISVKKVQDDVIADASNSECKLNATNDFKEFESAQDFDDFESFEDESVAKESQLDSVVSKTDSDDAGISVKPGQERATEDASEDNSIEFEEFQATKESTKDTSLEIESGNKLEAPNIEAVQSSKSGEKMSALANAEQDKKGDFDEFDDFQFASDEVANPSATTGSSVAVSIATTSKTDDSSSSWSAFSKELPSDESNGDSWAAFKSLPSDVATNALPDVVQSEKRATTTITAEEELKTPATAWKDSSTKITAEGSQVKFETLTSRVTSNCYSLVKETGSTQLQLLVDVIGQPQELPDHSSKSLSFRPTSMDPTSGESKSGLPDVCVWNNLKMMDLTSAFSFQWSTSSVSRNLLSAINVDLSSILVGNKKPQAPLFAGNLGLLEPMKAPTELQITQADKDPLAFAASESSSSSSSAVMSSAFSPQDVPQLEFDWGGSGLTNPLDAGNSFQLDLDFFVMSGHSSMVTLVSEATEKERELLDALEPPASESSMKMPPMSLETMMATLLPSIPSTQRIPKSQKDIDRKHLSEEAVQVLSKLPDLSFMQAKVLMFPLKDIASN